MKPSVRAWPFESNFLQDFAVVEERHGNRRLFPATDQLPVLSAAIDKEFYAGLTTRLAHTDARGDVLRKIELKEAALGFCRFVHSGRPDLLHVQPFYTPEGLTLLSVVQQISRATPQGAAHWFRQFRGAAFLPDIYLSGKRLVFASHVIERFGQRAALTQGHPVVELWSDFMGSVLTVMNVGGRPALTTLSTVGVVAFPFHETADEFFILTTLTANEINHLEVPDPPRALHFHYGPDFTTPPDTGTAALAQYLQECWRTMPHREANDQSRIPAGVPWIRFCQHMRKSMVARGLVAGSRLYFRANVYGPSLHVNPAKPRREPLSPNSPS